MPGQEGRQSGGGLKAEEVRSPRTEIRRRSEARNPKWIIRRLAIRLFRKRTPAVHSARVPSASRVSAGWPASVFGFWTSFGFRASSFGFDPIDLNPSAPSPPRQDVKRKARA